MKPVERFQLDGLIDGFVLLTIMEDGVKHQVRVTPRKMLGIVAQLEKVDDKTVHTVMMPVNENMTSFTISHVEASQLVSEIDELMKWKR